jgi:1-acyl-sn-glycerol-3-phosphate acyltransferase
MKYIRSIFLWLVTAIYLLLGAPVLSVGLILLSRNRLYPYVRRFFRGLLKLIGIKFTVEGLENIIPGKQYLALGNHQSLFDIAVVPAAIPFSFVGIEAAEHFRYPIWGWLTKKWGNIPIERYKIREAKESLIFAGRQFEKGTSIIILPEGHRTRTGEIGPFKKGPFHLALEVKADILPFAIKGLFEVKNRNNWLLTPGPVTVKIGTPIDYDSYKNMSVKDLMEMVKKEVEKLYGS